MKEFIKAFSAAALLLGLGMHGQAQAAFPDHPITVVIPFDGGGSSDVQARIVTKQMSTTLGQQFIIENHPGAGGTLGMDYTARAKPDGYTIVVNNILAVVAGVHFYKNITYDPVKSFSAVGPIGDTAYLLIVTPDFPAKDYATFLKVVRAAPDKYNGASAGVGSAPHLALEMFKRVAKVDIVHVPYKGSGPALNDVMAGIVQLEFENAAAIQLIKAGKLRALAVTGSERLSALPDVPTFTEVGQPDFEVAGHQGFLAPAGVPKDILNTLNDALSKAIMDPTTRTQLIAQSITPKTSTVDQFAAVVKNDAEVWGKLIKEANIQP